MTLIGAPQLRARLNALQRTAPVLSEQWAVEDERSIAGEIPHRTGATAASLHHEVDRMGARILGSPVITYLAGGTRAHTEEPRNRTALKFSVGGRTIFSARVRHPATPGNPGILDAGREALRRFTDVVYGLWNGAA